MPKGDIYMRGKYVVFFIGISKLIDAVLCGNSPIITNSKFYAWSTISIVVAIVSSLLFNFYFITKFGLIGGAISTILVMICVNSTNAVLLQIKLKINPFHPAQLKIAAVLAIFFAITFTGMWLSNPYIDSIVKTSLLGSAIVLVMYKVKLSEDFNQLLESKLPFIKRF